LHTSERPQSLSPPHERAAQVPPEHFLPEPPQSESLVQSQTLLLQVPRSQSLSLTHDAFAQVPSVAPVQVDPEIVQSAACIQVCFVQVPFTGAGVHDAPNPQSLSL
jgi:hypothetical protein